MTSGLSKLSRETGIPLGTLRHRWETGKRGEELTTTRRLYVAHDSESNYELIVAARQERKIRQAQEARQKAAAGRRSREQEKRERLRAERDRLLKSPFGVAT